MAPDGLEGALVAWFRDGRRSPWVDAVYPVAPESFELLGYFARGSELRAVAAAREVCRALADRRAVDGPSRQKEGPTAGVSRGDSMSQGAPEHAADRDVRSHTELVDGDALHDGLSRAETALVEVEALEAALDALSPWEHLGHHLRGSSLAQLGLASVEPVLAMVAETPALVRLAELLGRVEAVATGGHETPRAGRQRVEGVTFGADLADVLASERLLLTDGEAETLFALRFVERKLFQLEWSGGEPFGPTDPVQKRPRGPVIIAVDTSGSMTGAPLVLARAATLALVRRALRDGRNAHVVLFGGRGSVAGFDFVPGRASWEAFVAFLGASFGGGTDLAGPIRAALNLRATDARFRDADLALVSDGIAALPERLMGQLRTARDGGMRLGAMAIVRPGRGTGILDVLADPLEKLETAAFSV